MPTDLERIAAAAHYVIARTEPSKLGYVKLNKVLWYADLENYRRYGTSLTSLGYYTRMPQGPMSKFISSAVRKLIKAGKVAVRSRKVFDYTRRELIWIKNPDISMFNAEQIDILNQIIDIVSPLTAEEVSRDTHKDPLWKELKDNETMPIGPASVIARPPTPRQLEWALAHS
jgi:hypothetical protein